MSRKRATETCDESQYIGKRILLPATIVDANGNPCEAVDWSKFRVPLALAEVLYKACLAMDDVEGGPA